MCNCENMTNSVRDQKITEFFQSVLRDHQDQAGNVSWDKLEPVLRSLGRRLGQERLEKIRRRFEVEETGLIDPTDPEFITTIASLNVSDVRSIEDSVLATAFRIFDMVSRPGLYLLVKLY